MKKVRITIENIPGSPYSPSAKHDTPFLDGEDTDDWDARTWREHCTVNGDGIVCIPAMGLKQSIDGAAYKLGEKIEGRRGMTYKNIFSSGFLVNGDAPIANGKLLRKEDAEMKAINAHATGKRGSGSRVRRRFPEFAKYHATFEATILDDLLAQKGVFERHVRAAGILVGIGRFRPENGGTNGRFRVTKVEWEDVAF